LFSENWDTYNDPMILTCKGVETSAQSIPRSQSNKISQLSRSKNQVNQQHENNKSTTSQVVVKFLKSNLRIQTQVA